MSLTHPVRRRLLAVVAALTLAVTTACSDDPERADTESLSDATADGQAAEEEQASDDAPAEAVTASAASDASSEQPPADEPTGPALASLTVPISYIDGGELDMAVTSVDIAGELMRVRMTFTASLPGGSEPVALGAVLVGDETFPGTGISPELIDPVNLKAYEVVAGAIPNGTPVDLEDGVSHALVFYFAAPQDDMETVDLVLTSQTPPITDVPVAP